jgi:3-methyladenine DNA glycosylase AlkD
MAQRITLEEVVRKLKDKAKPEQLEGMKRYGISPDRRLGVSVPVIREIAKKIGKDHSLALELWKTGIAEAMIIASMIEDPKRITEEQMEDWIKDIYSWDICDQVCMNLLEKTPMVWKKIIDWSKREEEFVKRSAFALIACLAWHDKSADDERFIELIPEIEKGSSDDRNFVKKAVNWALRHIGKRNQRLNRISLDSAKRILKNESRSAHWIASNAIRELESEAVQKRLRNKKNSA